MKYVFGQHEPSPLAHPCSQAVAARGISYAHRRRSQVSFPEDVFAPGWVFHPSRTRQSRATDRTVKIRTGPTRSRRSGALRTATGGAPTGAPRVGFAVGPVGSVRRARPGALGRGRDQLVGDIERIP